MINRLSTRLGIRLARTVEWLAGDDRGATAVEYSLIIVLIAAVIAAVVGTLGQQVSSEFSKVVTGF